MSTISNALLLIPIPTSLGVYTMFIPWVGILSENLVRAEIAGCNSKDIQRVDIDSTKSNILKVFYNGTYFWKVMKSNYVHKERAAKKFELTE